MNSATLCSLALILVITNRSSASFLFSCFARDSWTLFPLFFHPRSFSFNLPLLLNSHPCTLTCALLFISPRHCSLVPFWALCHLFSLSLALSQTSQSQSSLASVHFSLELSSEWAQRLEGADERCCTNQWLLPHSVHKDKGLLSLPSFLYLSLSPSLGRNLPSICPSRGSLTDCEKRDSLWLSGELWVMTWKSSGHKLVQGVAFLARWRSPKPFNKPAEFTATQSATWPKDMRPPLPIQSPTPFISFTEFTGRERWNMKGSVEVESCDI